MIPKAPVHLHIPVELDPPRHRPYRKILNPMTSPAAIQALQPMIQAWTTWFIDQVIEDGECDFAWVIGVPAVVTLDWLGLDISEWRRYSSALHAVLAEHARQPRARPRGRGGHPWMDGADPIRGHRDRRRQPTDDLISWIARGRRSTGAPITDDAAYSMVELLISGGVGTTASLVSQALVHLPATRTSGGSYSTSRRSWSGPSRSSCARSPRPRRWLGP